MKSDPTFIRLASRDPVLFISRYSGLSITEWQAEMLYMIEESDRIIVLLPATHGKSTLLSLWYIVYKIAQNRNVRIIVMMKNDDEVKTYARSIRTVLSTNLDLREDFGRFQPQGRDAVWNNDSIIVYGRQIHDPQPTVLFASANTIDQVLGRRCDMFLADDIVTPTTVSTQAQRDKQWNIFQEGVETSPQYIWNHDPKTGKLLVPEGTNWPLDVHYEKGIIAGTVFHPDDMFHRKIGRVADMPHGKLIKCKDPSYRAIKYDCWVDKEKTIPLWPERWSAEKLRAKEISMGRIDFDKRFRNVAADEGSMVFKKHWLYGERIGEIEYPGCLDYLREMGQIPDGVDYLVLGIDPSTGRRGTHNSFTAGVLLGVDRKEDPMKRYIIDVYRAQIGFDDILSLITYGDDRTGIPGFYSLYKYDHARVEANAAQSYLLENARMREAALNGIKVLPHETQNQNRNDPLTGVASMQTMVKDGLLRIPYHNNPSTREKAERMIDELMLFPDGLNDMCMALWFAEIGVRKQNTGYRCYNEGPGRIVLNPRYREEEPVV